MKPLEALGRLALAVYYPQVRTGRAVFAAELALWAAAGLSVWSLLDPIADAAWISDAMLVRIAQVVAVLAGFWNAALFSICARRLHDLGLSGSWALMNAVPGGTIALVVLGLSLPGRSAGRVWPERAGFSGAGNLADGCFEHLYNTRD